ncbi:MAG: MATE family efflux transporter, partial [Ruminococcus sp.]|nr:MATE family efflux transporter [Ruminococcus sp.]
NSFGQACTTFTGQNYGANKPERCRKVLQLTLLQDMLCAIVLPLVILFFGRPLLGIFNSDPNIIATGMVRLRYILLAEFINVIIEIFSGYMRGFGYSLFPALTCTVCICGVRLSWVYAVFEKHQTFPMLMTCYPISWGLTAVVMLIVYFYMRNKYLADFFAQEKQTK